VRKPAALGGTPAFSPPLPFMRPTLPAFDILEPELRAVFASGMVTKGEHLAAFENELTEHLGVSNAVGVSSCTAGLMLVYRALGLSGEVVVPSFTFMATVHPLSWNSLSPVFADVDPDGWNLDPDAAEAAITPRTSAIVATHLFGNPANVEALQALARRKHLKLIFDAAHGFGALHAGRPVGRYGNVEVFSSSPTKLLVTGEGGVVTTNDAALAQLIRVGREYGNPGNYDTIVPGMNARMQEFSALLGCYSLRMLEQNVVRRNALVDAYGKGLAEVPGIQFQRILPGDRCSYKDFTVLIDAARFGLSRDALASALELEGIETRKYYSPSVHRQTAYSQIDAGALPVTARLSAGALSLPIFSHMETQSVERVCEAIFRIHSHAPMLREL
jgi:dTDP-4-amino-4,6-dideoxygalactose transaminase